MRSVAFFGCCLPVNSMLSELGGDFVLVCRHRALSFVCDLVCWFSDVSAAAASAFLLLIVTFTFSFGDRNLKTINIVAFQRIPTRRH